jgi:nitrogen fixation/metabolism regulation signal transduction histidine kinase
MNSIAPITSLSNTLNRFFTNDGTAKSPNELSEVVINNTIDGLTIIEEQGKALKHFVENYRKMTKIPQPKYNTIVVKDWLNSFALLYKGEMEEYSIKFRVAVDNRFTDLITDDKLLNQVIINVIKNAMSAVENSKVKEISMLLEIDKEGNKVKNYR